MIQGLDPRVDVVFEADGRHFLLKVPYLKAFMDSEVNYSWNYMWKEWLPDTKQWRCKMEDYEDWMKILHDFFGTVVQVDREINIF